MRVIKTNHWCHCSITRDTVDPWAPLVSVINCQLSPGWLNRQGNQTRPDHLPGGFWRTDDDAPSRLISAVTLHFRNHSMTICRQLTSTLPFRLFLRQHVERKRAQLAVGVGTCTARGALASHDSESPQKILPWLQRGCFSPTQSCEIRQWEWGNGVHQGRAEPFVSGSPATQPASIVRPVWKRQRPTVTSRRFC